MGGSELDEIAEEIGCLGGQIFEARSHAVDRAAIAAVGLQLSRSAFTQ
jgi:hypothetical protein